MKRAIRTAVNKVYAPALNSYDQTTVSACLAPLLDAMLADNGISKTSLAGKNVVLKPNLLAKREAEAGITSHPSFVHACAAYFRALDAQVIVADSPGGMYSVPILEGIYRTAGMQAVCDETGAKLNKDVSFQTVCRPEISPHTFHIITPLAEADLIVNLSRLKTHALCEISAAVKNLFGSIPGLQKAEQHARFPRRADFAEMLCDLCLINAPQINIIDGVTGMEGNGPAGGTLKKVGVVLASANPFAADLAAAHIMGYKPDEVGTVACAVRRGLCPADVSGLEITGGELADYVSEFRRPDASAGGLLKQIPTIFGGRLQRFLEPKPTVDRSKCIGCGACARNCPVSTIRITDKKARIDSAACIKCYCCQEFCPVKAIKVKRFFLFRF